MLDKLDIMLFKHAVYAKIGRKDTIISLYHKQKTPFFAKYSLSLRK